eukprot:jgi/Botrbrau1/13417/Bobra.0082s0023.1
MAATMNMFAAAPIASHLSFRSRVAAQPVVPPFQPLVNRQSRGRIVVPLAVKPREKSGPTGRVTYDESATRTSPLESAFTRRREIFVGRLAMTGFFSCVLGELLTGKGALGQLSLETNLPQPVVNAIVAGIVIFNLVTALNPAGTTFSEENQQDVRKRPPGGIQKPSKIDATKPQRFLGISDGFGFTRRNELFVGRTAMLGFAAELIGEVLTKGKGPLGQLGVPFNLPLNPGLAGFGLAVWIGFFAVAAIGYGPQYWGQREGDEEIY